MSHDVQHPLHGRDGNLRSELNLSSVRKPLGDTKQLDVECRCQNLLSQAGPRWRYSRSERCLKRRGLKSSPLQNFSKPQNETHAGRKPKTSMAMMLKAIRLMAIKDSRRCGADMSKNTSSFPAPPSQKSASALVGQRRTYLQYDNATPEHKCEAIEALVTRRNSPRSGRENSVWNSSFTLPTPPQFRSSSRGKCAREEIDIRGIRQ